MHYLDAVGLYMLNLKHLWSLHIECVYVGVQRQKKRDRNIDKYKYITIISGTLVLIW